MSSYIKKNNKKTIKHTNQFLNKYKKKTYLLSKIWLVQWMSSRENISQHFICQNSSLGSLEYRKKYQIKVNRPKENFIYKIHLVV